MNEFTSRVFDVTRNFVSYGEYGNNPKKAVAAIKKSFPDKTTEECASFFEAFKKAYENAIVFIDEHKAHFASAYAENKNPETIPQETNFAHIHPLITEEVRASLFRWIFHWYHER